MPHDIADRGYRNYSMASCPVDQMSILRTLLHLVSDHNGGHDRMCTERHNEDYLDPCNHLGLRYNHRDRHFLFSVKEEEEVMDFLTCS